MIGWFGEIIINPTKVILLSVCMTSKNPFLIALKMVSAHQYVMITLFNFVLKFIKIIGNVYTQLVQ